MMWGKSKTEIAAIAAKPAYHFGTEIPIPAEELALERKTWVDVENERARRGEDDAGHQGIALLVAIVFMAVVVGGALWLM